jgi:coproporphyrinogen III oxidase
MSTIIKLKHSDAGIGVNFYNDKEEKNYNKIIEFVKSSVSSKTPLSMTDVEWDLDNMTLGHSDPKADTLLKKITLRLEH